MSVDPQKILRELFDTAIAAAHPRQVLEPYLPADRSGRVIVIGAGIERQRIVDRVDDGDRVARLHAVTRSHVLCRKR